MNRGVRLLGVCMLICVLGGLLVGRAAALNGQTRYVSSSGDDSLNDCTDPANPCATLQYTINQSDSGDTIDVGGTLDANVTLGISLTITNWPGQAPAVLDGTNSGTVVTIDGTGASTPVVVTLSALTIENGSPGTGDGGGISNTAATLTVSDSEISNNSVFGILAGGGGISNAGGGSLTVENSTFSNNFADDEGGGILNRGTLDVENSTFSNNVASNGGGISDESGATLAVADSTISGNTTGAEGGGAIIEFGTGSVVRSTITGNSAPHNGAGINVQPAGTLLVADSTLTGNSAGDHGGGLSNLGTTTIESSTITGNSSGIRSGNDNVTLAGDILAGQASGSNCDLDFSATSIADAGYNVDDDGTCGLNPANHSVSHSTAIADYLGSLADNGGPTQTVALLNTPSPATAQADPALGVVPASFHLPVAVDGETAACSVPDQRGIAPAAGIGCDIGAYLLQQTVTSLGTSSGTVKAGVSVTYTATVVPSQGGGTVAFSDGSGNPATTNCAVRPVSSSKATCTVSYPASGSFSVSATYSGDGSGNNTAASTSSTLSQTVISAPDAPTSVSATAGDGEATVSFTAPASNGGVAINHYTVTGSPGGQSASGVGSPITVTGLTDGTAYTFTVTATNSVGTGAPSAASSAITPRDLQAPSAPGGLSGQITRNSLQLSWQASQDNVGVDHYEIYLNGSPVKRVAGATNATLRAFKRHGASVFTVRAFDEAGNQGGPSSSVTANPVPRPKSAPKHIPRWAFKLLLWQNNHTGARPATPKPLPHWYPAWRRWRNMLFRLAA